MISVTEERYFPYTPADIFNLVSDVALYPEFVPGVLDAQVRPISPTSFYADLKMGYQFFRETYSCIVHLIPHERIEIEYIEGPFEKLNNIWTFTPKGQGVDVKFFMEFSFRSSLLQNIITSMFQRVVESMIGAFEERAHATLRAVGAISAQKSI